VASFVATVVAASLLIASSAVACGAAERIGHMPSAFEASLAYGPDPNQILDIAIPDPSAFRGRRPLIVYLHAGGWIAGARSDLIDAMRAQVDRGYALASVEYRLATATTPAFPGAVCDVKRAIRYLKANARTWNLDPRRVILAGASAGGHLAAFVGATPGEFEPAGPTRDLARFDSRVVGIVDLVGPSDLNTFVVAAHPWAAPLTASFLGCPTGNIVDPSDCPADLLRRASVAPYVDSTDPPIFMTYGAHDDLVVPATQGRPLADLWARVHPTDTGATWYRETPTDHNLTTADLEPDLDRFLDGVSALGLRRRLAAR
jgi:acetyl esterase/lipase